MVCVEVEQDQQEQQQDQVPVREAPTRGRRVQPCVGADVLNQRGAQDEDGMY